MTAQQGPEGFPGWWCGACRGPLGSSEPSRDARCSRCGEQVWPLDERLYDALTDAGFDEEDATTAVAAVLPVVTREDQSEMAGDSCRECGESHPDELRHQWPCKGRSGGRCVHPSCKPADSDRQAPSASVAGEIPQHQQEYWCVGCEAWVPNEQPCHHLGRRADGATGPLRRPTCTPSLRTVR